MFRYCVYASYSMLSENQELGFVPNLRTHLKSTMDGSCDSVGQRPSMSLVGC